MPHEREPTLDEILNEPIIRNVMAVDGYTAEHIRYLMRQVAGAQMKPSKRDGAPQRLPHPAITAPSAGAHLKHDGHRSAPPDASSTD
ncbi:MAG: hypothetical protein E5Y58_01590 [Mesorhizobium sp.]|nr:MAG: hypothetical protein E5Y58_01590 [Mesorhizobium sp.]